MRARTVLLLVWALFLGLLYVSPVALFGASWSDVLRHPAEAHPLSQRAWMSLVLVALCALPAALMRGATLIVTEHGGNPPAVELLAPEGPEAYGNSTWNAMVASAKGLWQYEGDHLRRAIERLREQMMLFGMLASVSLCSVVLIALPAVELPEHGPVAFRFGPREILAVSAGTATAVFFALTLGQVLVRAASRDINTKMMSWASRNLLVVQVSAVVMPGALFVTDGWPAAAGHPILAGALVGAGVALLGSHVLRVVKERAALVVGAKPLPAGVDLGVIEGLGEEDVARLAEEGIDSVHALAFTPTPRVFLNTRYSLQRICDWQDQALLMVYLGPSRAQKFREVAMIRGALDAQRLALDLFATRRGAPEPSGDPFTGPRPTLDDQAWGRVVSQLGFASVEQAKLALAVLLDDEVIRRLRVFWRCSGKTGGGAGAESAHVEAVPSTLRVVSRSPASQPGTVTSWPGGAAG